MFQIITTIVNVHKIEISWNCNPETYGKFLPNFG